MDKKEEEQEVETISLKSNQSINESNLMVIPFISMKKTKVKVLERYWISNGVRRGIKVVGSGEHGCPTIAELDVLLA
ncbi:replication initiator protein A, partial [Clostridium botulinum]